MKKVINVCMIAIMSLLTFSLNAGNPPDDVTNAIAKTSSVLATNAKEASTTVYKDTKDLIKYSGNVLEKTAVRLDTILSKGYLQLAKGAGHSFEVLKTQQLVKSFHHLFFWVLDVILIFTYFSFIKKCEFSKDSEIAKGIFSGIVLVVLSVYNYSNFMEMWTGFLNPEYGVYLDIIEFLKTNKLDG